MLRKFFVAALFLATSGAAQATVIGFDGLDDTWFPLDPYVEDGFEVTFGNLIGGDGFLHIDTALGPFSASYNIAQIGGGYFSFASLDLLPIGTLNQFPSNPQDDFTLIGYRDGSIIGQVFGTAQNGGETLYGTAAFGNVDRLELRGLMTQNVIDAANQNGAFDVHLAVDNVTLGDVLVAPLPAAGLMLVSALGVLSALGRRRRDGSLT